MKGLMNGARLALGLALLALCFWFVIDRAVFLLGHVTDVTEGGRVILPEFLSGEEVSHSRYNDIFLFLAFGGVVLFAIGTMLGAYARYGTYELGFGLLISGFFAAIFLFLVIMLMLVLEGVIAAEANSNPDLAYVSYKLPLLVILYLFVPQLIFSTFPKREVRCGEYPM